MKRTVQLLKTDAGIRLPVDFCIQCGNEKDATLHVFEQADDNPIVHLAKLAGDASTLAAFALNKSRVIEAPFCPTCFKRFKEVPRNVQLFTLASLVTIFVAVVGAVVVSSLFNFETSLIFAGTGIVMAIAIRIWSRVYAWKHSPDFRRVISKEVILKVPGKGKIVCRM